MTPKQIFLALFAIVLTTSCVSKKKYDELMSMYGVSKEDYTKCSIELKESYDAYDQLKASLNDCLQQKQNSESLKDQQIQSLKDQVTDLQKVRDQQFEQVGDLTVLSKSANDNINRTLEQLAAKDKYINKIQQARTKADSINLVLAVNLKSSLSQGIYDQDIDVAIDKTVVFINLSDKMLFSSGSSTLTPRAKEVLGKIATIVQERPDIEVYVEGHTDSNPISRNCIKDNWDLSVERATSIVRVLQTTYGVDPAKLIASGRSEYLPIQSNATAEGRAANRRTRILIMPKLDQFYDLLEPQDNY